METDFRTNHQPPAFGFAGFVLDNTQGCLLTREGNIVPLTNKAFATLQHLARHAGETQTREQLTRAVWPDVVVEKNNLNQAIRAVRKVLKDDSDHPLIIETVPGEGWRFIADVQPVSLPAAQAPGLASRIALFAASLALIMAAAGIMLTDAG